MLIQSIPHLNLWQASHIQYLYLFAGGGDTDSNEKHSGIVCFNKTR